MLEPLRTSDKKEIALYRQQGKYLWHFKHIGFQSGKGGVEWGVGAIKPSYFIFDFKADFDTWFRKTQIGLAELDRVMNYCRYFVREKGNNGRYVREGRECQVNGEWDGYHIEGSAMFPHLTFDYPLMKSFRLFLKENSWTEDWFELADRYKDA